MSNRSRNASASIRGWDFQENAAIFLMIKHIEEAVSIRIEGETDDIEITLKDNSKLYAQAKSSSDPSSTKNVLSVLDKALETLTEDSQREDCHSIIYVFNFDDPFKEPSTIRYFTQCPSLLPYKDLPPLCKSRIDKLCEQKQYFALKKDSLFICSIPFIGDTDDRYRIIKDCIQNFLNNLEISNQISSDYVMRHWQHDFIQNASKMNTHFCISKEKMMWAIIAYLCRLDRNSIELEGYDICQRDTIITGFQEIINDRADNFQFVTRVVAAFIQFNEMNPQGKKTKDLISRFVEAKWQQFSDEFVTSDEIFDEVNIQDVVCITMRKVLESRRVIQKIKKGVNL